MRERTTNRLWKRLSALPTAKLANRLETLLQIPEESRTSLFDRVRRGPVTISGPSFNAAIDRYLALKAFNMQELNFTGIPPSRFKNLARYAGMVSMHKIARMPVNKRTAILVAFARAYETIALDEALDVLDLLIAHIAGEAKKLGHKKRLRTLKDLDKSALALAEVCTLILNESTQDELLRSAIFFKVPRERLTQAVAIVNELARPYDDNFQNEMVEQYGRIKRFLPKLLHNIEFKAAPAGMTTLEALLYLTKFLETRKQLLGPVWAKLQFEAICGIRRLLPELTDGLQADNGIG